MDDKVYQELVNKIGKTMFSKPKLHWWQFIKRFRYRNWKEFEPSHINTADVPYGEVVEKITFLEYQGQEVTNNEKV